MSTVPGPESVKVGVATVRVKVAEAVNLPDIPVIVTTDVPSAAEAPAVSVNWLFPVDGFGEMLALTPVGNPEMLSLTGLVSPLLMAAYTLLVVVVPCPIVTFPGPETVKVGA